MVSNGIENELHALVKELHQTNLLLREIGGILLTQSDAVRAMAETESEEDEE